MEVEGLHGRALPRVSLADGCGKRLITFESLRRSTWQLGLQEMGDDELVWMLSEGDLDGDGALNQTEFCILMLRLSPGLMEGPKQYWMEDMYT
ncbi:Calcium-binding protein KIC [Vitis vinifera]|uniref:Calcium-binding protein KIC n=1 Tax=Vitis vinifera TaxID=29760 RepID=A0A438JZF5_VITVI|nr:Calcium-binding protein KIC [Vitis vinifera]